MAQPVEYTVEITATAGRHLSDLRKRLGKKVFLQLAQAIKNLSRDPEAKTQSLAGKLSAYRSLHVSRCRVIVRIDDKIVRVIVVAAGWHTSGSRDDVYQAAIRLLEAGRLDPALPEPGDQTPDR